MNQGLRMRNKKEDINEIRPVKLPKALLVAAAASFMAVNSSALYWPELSLPAANMQITTMTCKFFLSTTGMYVQK